ncbi:hypothetical protein MOQ72_33535 [Saccharopolyspora sp. K220]|uniref:hypothetical protein n=1 Tax=Saccharopolyspora soli TaxID=2926618 RepID=UPI001F57AEE4|nr:hypothetical protein [Saccharopolyspora soli]MCI2422361.1 hypothetical protein [Saccharopolyspora soli]
MTTTTDLSYVDPARINPRAVRLVEAVETLMWTVGGRVDGDSEGMHGSGARRLASRSDSGSRFPDQQRLPMSADKRR